MASPDWEAVRRQFPALTGRTYLNTATYGQLPYRASQAAIQHFQHRDELACTDFLSWFEDLEPLRTSLAKLVNATRDDIAFVPNASHGLSLALNAIDWQSGDEILTLEDEYPNQLYGAQSVHGAIAVQCRWEELEQRISSRTRVALLSTVNYTTGMRPDLAIVVSRLRKRGVFVFIDGTQSVGALQFDCTAIAPHFLVVDAYKWMLSPNGAAFLYVDPAVRKWLRPRVIGWRSDYNWRNVDALHHGAPRFTASAEKYEGGMLPFPCLYAMKASVELLEELGQSAIEERVLGLSAILREELGKIGAEFQPTMRDSLPSQILAVQFPGADVSRLTKDLSRQNVIVSARKGYLRISPHFYNNEEDVGKLIQGLRRCLAGV